MIIENVISDTIDFFHMDALSATVPMKIHVDIQLTLIAGLLYRLLGIRVGERKELAETRTLFRELIPKRDKIHLTEKEIIVQYPRRVHNPLLMNAEYHNPSSSPDLLIYRYLGNFHPLISPGDT